MSTLNEDIKAELARRRNSAGGTAARIRDKKPVGHPDRVVAERDLAEAMIAEYVTKTVAKFGSLRPEQVERVVHLLGGGSR